MGPEEFNLIRVLKSTEYIKHERHLVGANMDLMPDLHRSWIQMF